MYTTTTLRVAGTVVALTAPPQSKPATSFVMVQDRRTGEWRLPTPSERATMWAAQKAGEPKE